MSQDHRCGRAGIHSRAPISACPVPSRAYVRCTVLMPLATLPTQRAVPRTLGDRPPIPSAQVAHHRGGVLARLQPRLGPREARPQQSRQLSALPAPQRGAYPGDSSRLRFCYLHKRMIDRRLRSANRFARRAQAQVKARMAAAVLGAFLVAAVVAALAIAGPRACSNCRSPCRSCRSRWFTAHRS
jgi:hypothetical protein